MKRTPLTLLTASVLLVGGAIASSPASAGGRGHSHHPPAPAPAPEARTIAEGLFTPLSLAIDNRGRALVTQNFLGELLRITPDGGRSTIATAGTPGLELGSVSTRGKTTYWTTSTQEPPTPSAALYAQKGNGAPRQIADLRAFEDANNPDGGTTYGFRDLAPECLAQIPAEFPASYTGILDSHPYATTATKKKVYVADAAANAILSVRTDKRRATPKVVAVLPPVGTEVTAEAAAAQGLPACVAGHTYYFEFVPTDVELGDDGWLYVTALPGGPEDESLGARGAVYKVSPYSGKVRHVAGGFVGAVNLALLPGGTIAVAELFGGGTGQVTLVKPRSSKRTTLALPAPGAVEWVDSRRGGGKLYVTTDAFSLQTGPAPTGKLQVLSFSAKDLSSTKRGSRRH